MSKYSKNNDTLQEEDELDATLELSSSSSEEEQENRFISFETWEAALEKEWGEQSNNIRDIERRAKEYTERYCNFQNQKLEEYSRYDDLKESTDALKIYLNDYDTYNAKAIRMLDKISVQYKALSERKLINNNAELYQTDEDFCNTENTFRSKHLTIITFKKKAAILMLSLQNEQHYTNEFIEALKSNDQETLESFKNNKHLHSDITKERYMPLLGKATPSMKPKKNEPRKKVTFLGEKTNDRNEQLVTNIAFFETYKHKETKEKEKKYNEPFFYNDPKQESKWRQNIKKKDTTIMIMLPSTSNNDSDKENYWQETESKKGETENKKRERPVSHKEKDNKRIKLNSWEEKATTKQNGSNQLPNF